MCKKIGRSKSLKDKAGPAIAVYSCLLFIDAGDRRQTMSSDTDWYNAQQPSQINASLEVDGKPGGENQLVLGPSVISKPKTSTSG